MSDIIHFAESAIERAIDNLQHDPGAIFANHIVDMLRDLRNVDFAEFVRKRERIKETKKVKMNIFDSLICEEPEGDDPERNKWLFNTVTPCEEPVNPAELLNDMVRLLRRFVIADDDTLHAAALWCAFTWFHDCFKISPLAIITAPEMRAGKTILLLVMSEMVRRPLITSNISAGALVRSIDKYEPTLLVDEVDSFLRYNEELRGIINGGLYKKNAYIVRCAGDNFNPQVFSTWAPKVLAGIGKLSPTIEDRAIRMVLRRKMINEHTDRLSRTSEGMWQQLRSRLARFFEDSRAMVADVDPVPIAGLDNRANDCWEPLQAIATVAGDEWLERARSAAIALSFDPDSKPSIGMQLLQSVRAIFDGNGEAIKENMQGHYITCADLLDQLVAIEDEPWSQMNLTVYRLGMMLSNYKIRAISMRDGEKRCKGYYLESFSDVFLRYLPKSVPDMIHDGDIYRN